MYNILFLGYTNFAGERLAEKRNKMEKKYENECKCDTKKHISGIKCDVTNCAYHNGKSECYAGCISVGPHSATSSSDTTCVTFKPKEY